MQPQEHGCHPQCLPEWQCKCEADCAKEWQYSSGGLDACLIHCGGEELMLPGQPTWVDVNKMYAPAVVQCYRAEEDGLWDATVAREDCYNRPGAEPAFCDQQYVQKWQAVATALPDCLRETNAGVTNCLKKCEDGFAACQKELSENAGSCSDLIKADSEAVSADRKSDQECRQACSTAARECGEAATKARTACRGAARNDAERDECERKYQEKMKSCGEASTACIRGCDGAAAGYHDEQRSRAVEIKECEEKIYQALSAGLYACEKTLYEEVADCTEPDQCRWGTKIKGRVAYRQCEMDHIKAESELRVKLLQCTNGCASRSERCYGDEDCLKAIGECDRDCGEDYRPKSLEAGFKVLPCYQQTFGELTGQMAECCELAEPKFEHGKRDSYDCRKKAYNAMVPVAQAYGNCLAAGNADCQKKTWGQYGVIYRDWAKCRGEKLELYLRERQAFNPSVARCGMECDGDFFAKVMSCLQQFPEDNFNGILNCWLAEWPALTECRYQCAKGNDLLPAKESRAVYNCRSKVILAAQKCFYDERGGMVGTYADCMKTARDEMKSCCEQIEQQYGGRQYSPATDFATGAVDRFSEVLLYLALPVVYPPYLDFMGAAWLKEREPEIYNGQELFRGPWGCFNWTWIFMGSSPKWEDKDNSAS